MYCFITSIVQFLFYSKALEFLSPPAMDTETSMRLPSAVAAASSISGSVSSGTVNIIFIFFRSYYGKAFLYLSFK